MLGVLGRILKRQYSFDISKLRGHKTKSGTTLNLDKVVKEPHGSKAFSRMALSATVFGHAVYKPRVTMVEAASHIKFDSGGSLQTEDPGLMAKSDGSSTYTACHSATVSLLLGYFHTVPAF